MGLAAGAGGGGAVVLLLAGLGVAACLRRRAAGRRAVAKRAAAGRAKKKKARGGGGPLRAGARMVENPLRAGGGGAQGAPAKPRDAAPKSAPAPLGEGAFEVGNPALGGAARPPRPRKRGARE
jgi:hypothetical protein